MSGQPLAHWGLTCFEAQIFAAMVAGETVDAARVLDLIGGASGVMEGILRKVSRYGVDIERQHGREAWALSRCDQLRFAMHCPATDPLREGFLGEGFTDFGRKASQ